MKLYRLSFLALLVPSIAAAHIRIVPQRALANTTGQKITFAINHGCNNSTIDTLSIKIDIPAGIDAKKVRAMPSDFGGKPEFAREADGTVTSITWRRDPADIQPADLDYYEITIKANVANVPFTKIPFTITQVCRPPGGAADGSQDVTAVWTGPQSNPEPAAELFVTPTHEPGWNKITLATAVPATSFGDFFGDAQIVWKGTSAFSPNKAVGMLITMTPNVTALGDLAAGDEIWVKY